MRGPCASPFTSTWLAPGAVCFADFFGLNCTVPTLPVFLLAWASTTLTESEATDWSRTWSGLILSAQALAKMPGHLVWGRVSAKLGSRPTVTVVMVLNAVAFAASALFAIGGLPLGAVAGLLVVRLLAGFFAPIVPAFVFLFDRQAPSPQLVAAIGKLGGMILAGLTLGSASVGLPFGSAAAVWAGVCALSALVALLVLIPVYTAPPVLADVAASARRKPEGVRKALGSREYLTHALTSCASGWGVVICTALPAVHEALYFEYAVEMIALFATVSALLNVMTAIGVVPRLVARYSIARSVYIGHTWQVVTMVLLSLPWVNRHRVAYPIVVAATFPGLCLAVNPNQGRASIIARLYTVNGTGTLTGVSRLLFSFGEFTAPLVCINLLYPVGRGSLAATEPRIGTMLPYMLSAVIHAAVLAAYAALGISPSHVDAPPAVKAQPASTSSASAARAAAAGSPSAEPEAELQAPA